VAVVGSNLDMYKGHVTALLGHNGAGKTTTMSMITGLYPPTSGSAIVNGHNVTTDVKGAQRSLGICPQHDVLFDTLTVEEHLRFFCRLKGVPADAVQTEVDAMLASVRLTDKRNAQSKTLSGGQKRRLSCGMAFVGGSEVVILDEPTSGCDPAARRAIWELIKKCVFLAR
jgi:ATP-binding cassette subfamily A (ABC1) protein 3